LTEISDLLTDLLLRIKGTSVVGVEVQHEEVEIKINRFDSSVENKDEGSGVNTVKISPDLAKGTIEVESPITGVFYRSSTPGDPPFVDVGDEITVGQVIGLVEAMKIFNEVVSDKGGVIQEILVEDSTDVRAGMSILKLRPHGNEQHNGR